MIRAYGKNWHLCEGCVPNGCNRAHILPSYTVMSILFSWRVMVCVSLPTQTFESGKKKKKMIGQNKRVISSSAYSKMLGSKEALENIYLNEWIKYVKIICTGKTIRSQYKYSKMLIVLNYCRDVMGDYFLYFFKFLNFMFYILKIICFSSKEWTVLIS